MSDEERWILSRIDGAPPVLRARVEESISDQRTLTETLASRLAIAARVALARASADSADRSAAIELLTADALVTLALLRQAEECPTALGEFAAGVRTQAPVP